MATNADVSSGPPPSKLPNVANQVIFRNNVNQTSLIIENWNLMGVSLGFQMPHRFDGSNALGSEYGLRRHTRHNDLRERLILLTGSHA